MKTVWILENAYDHGRVELVGVFSTEENALKFKSIRNDRDDGDPYEIGIDDNLDWENGPVYVQQINKNDGSLWTDSSYVQERMKANPNLFVSNGPRHPKNPVVGVQEYCISATSPISLEHATDVVIAAREEWLKSANG